MSDDTITAKIAKLLALAEGAVTEAEALAAYEAAQRLATKHAIDLAVAAASRKGGERAVPVWRRIDIGKPRGRANGWLSRLLWRVCDANDCRAVLHKGADMDYMRLVGLPSDLDTVELVYAALAHQMARTADEYVRSQGDRLYGPEKPQARATHHRGFIDAVSDRLSRARKGAVLEARRESSGSTDLVLADKEALVLAAERAEYPRLRQSRGPSSSGSWSDYLAGHSAGNLARMGTNRVLGA